MFSQLAPRTAAVLAAALLLSPCSLAFDTPLSAEAIREAYFLGQRHDGSYPRLLEKYVKSLPPPETGPYISSVSIRTPFIQVVARSDAYIGNYSAQQAELDHRAQGKELVQVFVDIELTESYGPLMPVSASPHSSSAAALIPRSSDFWKDFQVRIYDGAEEITTADSHGHAKYSCGRYGPCLLTGATLEFDFPASAFTSDSATIDVMPPAGEPVSVDFDLSSLR